MIPYHVCPGMNGAIMVLPRGGLRDRDGNPLVYDQVFYIGEQDYYIARDADGNFISYESAMDDYGDALDTMRKLIPSHVVFNGAKGSLTGDNALQAKVGERVLFVHLQANRDTRPHLIGGHGDYSGRRDRSMTRPPRIWRPSLSGAGRPEQCFTSSASPEPMPM
jgi:nitrite reductase (NO-forming)